MIESLIWGVWSVLLRWSHGNQQAVELLGKRALTFSDTTGVGLLWTASYCLPRPEGSLVLLSISENVAPLAFMVSMRSWGCRRSHRINFGIPFGHPLETILILSRVGDVLWSHVFFFLVSHPCFGGTYLLFPERECMEALYFWKCFYVTLLHG